MKSLPAKTCQPCGVLNVTPRFAPVYWVSQKRVANRVHVHANLVRTSGFKTASEQRAFLELFQHLIESARRFST